ncbi:MAG: prepilin-type N-terminal cleavage/methylation domain-containing protein [bacterium]|nr:prepilin-type N-terminal cleavage/methylation domain-containing protein [bacterium]
MEVAGNSARSTGGFTLVEVMLALFLLALGVLASAPMFVLAMQGNAAADDVGAANALAEQRLELLRTSDYDTLVPGGSLTSNVTGFFDDTNPDFIIRWEIATNATPPSRALTVQATALRSTIGVAKQSTITTLRSE